jgi:uncharacterized membrane protein
MVWDSRIVIGVMCFFYSDFILLLGFADVYLSVWGSHFHSKNPHFYSKNPIFIVKTPIFIVKKPIFIAKTPIFLSKNAPATPKSPNFTAPDGSTKIFAALISR